MIVNNGQLLSKYSMLFPETPDRDDHSLPAGDAAAVLLQGLLSAIDGTADRCYTTTIIPPVPGEGRALRDARTSAMREQPRTTRHDISRYLGFWTEERSLTALLILLLLHFFVLTPGTFLGHAFQMIAVVFLALALLAGILALQRRIVRRLGILVMAGGLPLRVAAVFGDSPWLIIGDKLFTLLSLSALILIMFRQVSMEGPVSAHRVRGAIALYLLIAIFFAFLYGLSEELAPGAFSMPGRQPGGVVRGEAFYYFSIVTLTTVGFGDITAVHPFVRSLVMLEALLGQLYPAVLLARLVTLELETRRSGK
jgi:hypothetical protein